MEHKKGGIMGNFKDDFKKGNFNDVFKTLFEEVKVFHGRPKKDKFFKYGLAIFTKDIKNIEFFSFDQGESDTEPVVSEHTITALQPANMKDLITAVSDIMANEDHIKENSPYNADNVFNFLYVPMVRNQLERQGFDSFYDEVLFHDTKIKVYVIWHKRQIK